MLRKTRTSIARLMGVVLVAGLGFATLRNASEDWAGAMLLVTCAAVMLAMVGALCRAPGDRPGWLGFALFGGGYLAMAHGMAASNSPLPTITLAEFIASKLGAIPAAARVPRGVGWDSLPPSDRIVHCLWALGLAALGWLLAGVLVGRPTGRAMQPVEEPRSARRLPHFRWWWPTLFGLAGFWIVAMTAVIGRWPAPGIWAGASFLLSCGLLGLAALAAAFGRGIVREACLGAALFGFGYLVLSFGKSDLFIVAPHLPTEGMINSLLRPGGPPTAAGFPDFTTAGYFRVREQLLQRKLNELIPFHFSQDTSLDEVLKYIRTATRDVNFPGIPIYVDPIGLQNTERSLNSTVRIDVDAIPVRDGLRLCLKQLGLGFTARSGYVQISDEDSATIPVYEDPVQVVGHSLLALLAAGLGAVAAPFVLDRAARRRGGNTP